MSFENFKILLHNHFIKKTKRLRLSQSYINKMESFLSILKSDPIPWKNFDIKKIEGSDNIYRVRIGIYRIFYSLDKNERIIKILDIETREKAYR